MKRIPLVRFCFFPLFYFSVKILHTVRKAVVFKTSYSYIMLNSTANIGITSITRPKTTKIRTCYNDRIWTLTLTIDSFEILEIFIKFSKNDINDLQMFLKVIKSRNGMEPNGIMLRTH